MNIFFLELVFIPFCRQPSALNCLLMLVHVSYSAHCALSSDSGTSVLQYSPCYQPDIPLCQYACGKLVACSTLSSAFVF